MDKKKKDRNKTPPFFQRLTGMGHGQATPAPDRFAASFSSPPFYFVAVLCIRKCP